MIGCVVDGYTIKKKIGEGGMGEVYFAQDPMGQKAAIKIMREEYRNRADLRTRFMTEMKAMISLQGHPNIVELESVTGINDGVIVMEYLEGQDLYRYVQEKGQAVDEKTLIGWAKQIISALEFAHSKGIIHRDIKPSNIFLTKFHVIKVLDFGIAKVIQQDATGAVDETLLDDLTKTRANLGAPQYMSPEQTFDPKLVTHLSDIYSFGKTLNYLATGGNPMIKPSSALHDIIKKCTEQCPEDRYQDWGTILSKLTLVEQSDDINNNVLFAEELYDSALNDIENELFNEAVIKLKQSSRLGNLNAMYKLALYYLEEESGEHDVTKGLSFLMKAAEGNVSDAQFYLGYLYEYSMNVVPVNLSKSKQWYEKAAENGHEMAMERLKKTKFWYV